MERTELVKVLRTVSPALMAGKEANQTFKSVFFFDGKAHAYDDEVAISTPCVLPDGESIIGCGVDGKLLQTWASGCRGVDVKVTLSEDGEAVKWGCGRSRIKTPFIPHDTYSFTRPDDKSVKIAVKKDFVKSLRRASITLGDDNSNPETSGITLQVSGEGSVLYSTNNWSLVKTESVSKLLTKGAKPRDILLPSRFVDLLLTMSKGDKLVELRVSENWQEVKFESGTVLWGKGPKHKPNVASFERVLGNVAEPVFDVPKGLSVAFKNLGGILALGDDKAATIGVSGGKLNLKGSTPAGAVNDHVSVPDHPDVKEQSFSPKLALKAFEFADKLEVGETLVMTGESFLYVQAFFEG